jgi:hypothetical protein
MWTTAMHPSWYIGLFQNFRGGLTVLFRLCSRIMAQIANRKTITLSNIQLVIHQPILAALGDALA